MDTLESREQGVVMPGRKGPSSLSLKLLLKIPSAGDQALHPIVTAKTGHNHLYSWDGLTD